MTLLLLVMPQWMEQVSPFPEGTYVLVRGDKICDI